MKWRSISPVYLISYALMSSCLTVIACPKTLYYEMKSTTSSFLKNNALIGRSLGNKKQYTSVKDYSSANHPTRSIPLHILRISNDSHSSLSPFLMLRNFAFSSMLMLRPLPWTTKSMPLNYRFLSVTLSKSMPRCLYHLSMRYAHILSTASS